MTGRRQCVMSSSVGPRPPVIAIRSAQPKALHHSRQFIDVVADDGFEPHVAANVFNRS